MKKTTISFAILALVCMTMPAWAGYTEPVPAGLVNKVANGDFQTGNFNGWSNDLFQISNFPSAYVAASVPDPIIGTYEPGPLSTMFQVIDESLFDGWDPNGTGKKWWLSFWYHAAGIPGQWISSASAYAYYYTSNPDTQPAFGGPSDPGADWELLYSSDPLARSTGIEVEMNGAVKGFQPRWIALAFEGQSSGNYRALFDNVEFYGQCVPLPPSLLLLGSSLLGLICLGRRPEPDRHHEPRT